MSNDALVSEVRKKLQAARSVTVLTGAGISAESGVPTFRGADGFWKGRSAMDLASPQGFARDPHAVWEWYNLRRTTLLTVRPNAGHAALAALEKRVPEFGLVTQNVDRLHQAAGSRRLVELHGNIREVRCTGCGEVLDRGGIHLPAEPRCEQCGAWLRPNVVWFGEQLPPEAMATAEEWTMRAEVFMVIGTSAVVMPAAGLVYLAKSGGALVVELNVEETDVTDVVDISLRGKSGEILPELVGVRT